MVVNFKVYKILIDSGSTVDMLFYIAIERIKLLEDKHMPIQCLIHGFNGETSMPIRVITLLITLGIMPIHLNLMVDFLVIKLPSAYNMILGCPCMRMRMARAFLSTYHLIMEFLTEASISEIIKGKLVDG